MKLRYWLACFMAMSLLITGPGLGAQEIGSVSEVTGGVDILRGGKLPAEAAKVGTKLSQGDVVRTKSGGKVQLSFKDESVLTIAPDSRVALNEYVYEPEANKREASIKIFQGLVHTVVNKVMKKEAPDFTVETQTAVIGVRGTDYYTLVGPAVSDIYNNSGITEVRNVFAEIPGKVNLRGREFTQVSKNLPPTLPLPLTEQDINWIRGQMMPKMAARATGGGSTNSHQLMSNVAGSAVRTSNVSTPIPTALTPIQTNVIENIQSAVYVPPEPVRVLAPVVTPTTALPTPFNIAVAWGSGAQDLDLYLSQGPGTTPIYYGNTGSPTSTAYYPVDSRAANGGEVITVNRWTAGQTYVAYVQDFSNSGIASSTVLSTYSNVTMKLISGGSVSEVAIPSGSKAVVTGGTQVGPTYSVPSNLQGAAGNQWQVVSINPSTGVITPINTINPYDTPVQEITATSTSAPSVTAPVSGTAASTSAARPAVARTTLSAATPVVTPATTSAAATTRTTAVPAVSTVTPPSTVRPATATLPATATAR